jgi:hypothetical protein
MEKKIGSKINIPDPQNCWVSSVGYFNAKASVIGHYSAHKHLNHFKLAPEILNLS